MALNPNGGCTTPNELGLSVPEQQQMEREIERMIIGHFRGSTAAIGAIDIFTDPGTGGPQALTDWLSRNSFGKVIDKKKMMDGFGRGEYAVPDIMTSRGALGKSEFYEIKPASQDGINRGRGEVARIEKLVKDFDLLFFAGTEYDPNMNVPFNPFEVAGETYDVQLKWFRDSPGLIVYEICYRRRKKAEEPSHFFEYAFAFLIGLILLFILRGKNIEFGPVTPIEA